MRTFLDVYSSKRLYKAKLRTSKFGNDDRHFAKEELPRVAYNNPALTIEVDRRPKVKEEKWDPELVVGLGELVVFIFQSRLTIRYTYWLTEDGTTKTINMHMKHSTKILSELLAISK